MLEKVIWAEKFIKGQLLYIQVEKITTTDCPQKITAKFCDDGL